MAEFSYLFSLFISLVATSLPFLLLGIFLSSILLVFIDDSWLLPKLPRNRLLGAILGSSLGLIIPVGQYGNIPFTRRLLLKGVSLPLAISFLVASPTLNIWVIGITWSLFPHQTLLIFSRIIIAWLSGVLLGFLFSFYPKSPHSSSQLSSFSPLLRSGSFIKTSDISHPLHESGSLIYESVAPPLILSSYGEKMRLWLKNSHQELLELGSVLIAGCAIAAILQFYFIPNQWINLEQTAGIQLLRVFGLSFWLSVGSWMGTAVMNAFSGQLLRGSLLAFLLFSSFLDIKGIILMLYTLKAKPVFILLLLLSQFVFVITLLLTFLIDNLP